MSGIEPNSANEPGLSLERAREILEEMAQGRSPADDAPPPAIRPWKTEPWRAELRYRALVEKIPAVTFVADLDQGAFQELYISPQIESLLGFSQEEWLENPFLWYYQLHPEDRERWAEEFARTCATGAHFRSDYRLIARDGHVVWVHGECQVVRDEEGRPLFLQGIAFDITASKTTEETLEARVQQRTAELADSEGRLRAILETAVDAIITIDERGRILSFNPAATRLFGYTTAEVLGKNVNLLMPAPYHDEHDAYLTGYLNTGLKKIIGIGREVSGRRKDGSLFPMDLAVSETLGGAGRIFTGIVRDISRRKNTERELTQAKEAAEAANHAKDHFLAVLSHELRTPLTPVLATVEMLRRQGNLPEEVAASLETIHRNVEMEARIIDDLLDLTRISRGKVELRLKEVDAHLALKHALDVWQRAIEAKRLELSLNLWARRHHVHADPIRLQQVFWNLIGNAVKFTPEEGRLTLRSVNDEQGRLIVTIADTGIGIDSDLLPRLFNAFEQGERTVTRRYGGLGLGLTISRALMEMHGGTLIATSEGAGHGATFTLSISTISAPAKDAPQRIPPKKMAENSYRILLVEDHEDTLRVMARLLRSCGYTVGTAASVQAALRMSETEQFDLLISDLGLPDGSGLDLVRQIKTRQQIRGIALSGFGMDEDIARTLEAGFDRHLTKPVSVESLEKAIRGLPSLAADGSRQ